MKRFIVLIWFMVYSLSSFGISLNYFYCCDKLKEVTLSLNSLHREDCTMKMDDKKCCDNKTVTLKISPDQKQSPVQLYNLQPLSSSVIIPPVYRGATFTGDLHLHPQYHNLPPPLVVNRTVLHANFRI